jgi:hypothetical protein
MVDGHNDVTAITMCVRMLRMVTYQVPADQWHSMALNGQLCGCTVGYYTAVACCGSGRSVSGGQVGS